MAWAMIQRTGRSTVHLVYASGGPEDGSLVGFETLCTRKIDTFEGWVEQPHLAPSCKVCLKVRAAWEPRRAKAEAGGPAGAGE